jgi:hypothetical protein
VKLRPGDLVRIDPMWFGYDNILPQWNDSVFIILEVHDDSQRSSNYKPAICHVLAPEGKLYEFYDYELILAADKNSRKNILL